MAHVFLSRRSRALPADVLTQARSPTCFACQQPLQAGDFVHGLVIFAHDRESPGTTREIMAATAAGVAVLTAVHVACARTLDEPIGVMQ